MYETSTITHEDIEFLIHNLELTFDSNNNDTNDENSSLGSWGIKDDTTSSSKTLSFDLSVIS